MHKKNISKQLNQAIQMLYAPSGVAITMEPVEGKYNREYGAVYMGLNNLNVVYRNAKITPKKIGQFVVAWKKKSGINAPYDSADNIHLMIVDVSVGDKVGQFIFDKKVLVNKGILTHENRLGKMAFRVYPPWVTPKSKQAIVTQKWQLKYFISYENLNEFDKLKLNTLIHGDEN